MPVPEAHTQPHVCVFTVHNAGDQRILRQIRSFREAGYRTTLIDLGPVRQHTAAPGEEHLTLALPQLRRLSRLLASGRVAVQAWRTPADIYHFHDLWLIPAALLLRVVRRRPVVYDVHEYYPESYAARSPVLGRAAGGAVRILEHVAARVLKNLSVVSPELAQRFGRRGGVRIALTPNLPSLTSFPPMQEEPAADFAARLRRVVHTGGLTRDRGSLMLIDIGHEIDRRGLDVSLTVVRRFPQVAYRRDFESYLAERGTPRCLEMVDSMHPDELGRWLHGFGIGLSVVQDVNPAQNCVNTKLYEYALAGVTVIASDLSRPRQFISERLGHGEIVPPADPAAYVDAIERIMADPAGTQEGARRAAERTYEMSWEGRGAPPLLALYSAVVGFPGRPDSRSRDSHDVETRA